MKLISNSYLYQIADFGPNIYKYLVHAHVIDKSSDSFTDIVYDVKRRVNSIILKVLLSNKVRLLIDETDAGVARAFKVIYAKDPKSKDKNKRYVYIDCTGIINFENGIYKCKNIGILISYLTTAMVYILYNGANKAITSNHTVTRSGAEAFVDLMLYVLSNLKVPITYMDNKEKMSFVLAEYFLTCIMEFDYNAGEVYNTAKQISGIKDKKTCDFLHVRFGTSTGEHCDIKRFLEEFSLAFVENEDVNSSNKNKLDVDAVSRRWMHAYGPGTFLGLECFVPFSAILTDCYNGAYINNQNTIEKIVGGKNVHKFTNELIKIGSENA